MALWAPNAAAQTKIVGFGDSITFGLGETGISCDAEPGGYPPRLDTLLTQQSADVELINEGVCDELTAEGLTRIDTVLENRPDTDAVLLMEGTNDLSRNNISLESMRFNLGEMADKVRWSGVEPISASPIPRAPDAGSNDRTALLAERLGLDATEADMIFVDPYTQWVDLPDLFDLYYSDTLHPNDEGYDLLAELFVESSQEAILRTLPTPCVFGDENLCLSNGRFKVEVDWATEDEAGRGQTVPLSGDTGLFWFFSPQNLELVVKVLDGRAINGHFWVFYGALSDVEFTLTVTDSETGDRKVYRNPLGTQASDGDIEAFAQPDGFASSTVDPSERVTRQALDPAAGWLKVSTTDFPASDVGSKSADLEKAAGNVGPKNVGPKNDCETAPETLCLRQDRFSVKIRWTDPAGESGDGTAVVLTGETGYFWFFNNDNVEVVIKVLDGRAINGHFWVFYGALSDVAYEIEVTDTTNGNVATYVNPLGEFGSESDIEALPEP